MIKVNGEDKPIWMLLHTDRKIVICETCRGTGQVRVITDDPVYDGPWKKNCNSCGGRGSVGKVIRIEHERLIPEIIKNYAD